MFVVPVSRVTARTYRQPAFNGHPFDADRALDRLLGDTLDRVFNRPVATVDTRLPALDLHETAAAYTAQLDLPGFAKDEVKVSIDGKRVSIEASTRQAASDGEPADATAVAASPTRVVVRERSSTAFGRSFTLPVEIDESSSQAKLENGVLTLTLAKKVRPAAQLTIG